MDPNAIGVIGKNAVECAALSLLTANTNVITTSFKITFVAPVEGDGITAYGHALKSSDL